MKKESNRRTRSTSSKKTQINSHSTKADTPKTQTTMLKIPNNPVEFFYLYFNKKENTLKCSIYYENKIINNLDLRQFPIEKCSKCKSDLIIENSYYMIESSNIKFYCNLCSKENKQKLKLIQTNNSNKNNCDLLTKIKEYETKNEKSATSKELEQIDDLIIFIKNLSYLEDLLTVNNNYNNQYKIIKNCLNNLSFYFNEINKIEMEDIHLFLLNFLLIGITSYEKSWFVKNFIGFYKENITLNISKIRTSLFQYLIKLILNKETLTKDDYKQLFDNYLDSFEYLEDFLNVHFSNRIKLYTDFDFDRCYIIFYTFKNNYEFAEFKVQNLKTEIKILENEINQMFSNYYYSYNTIASRKVIERKIINSWLILIFKNYYKLFEPIKEDEKILNAIIKELKGISIYFANKVGAKSLVDKIKKEILYYEKKRYKIIINKNNNKDIKSNNNISKTNKSKVEKKKEPEIQKLEKHNIVINENEMKLLKEYSVTNLDNTSFTTILADKTKHGKIQANKLQVIVEFLFFMRDEAIDIIHLLKKSSALYFSLLNSPNIIKDDESIKNEDTNINECESDMNINNNYKEKNEKLFNEIKVNRREDVLCKDCFKYLFQEDMKLNYKKEIQYLIDNITIPHNLNKKLNNNTIGIKEMSGRLLNCKKKINSIFDIIDNSFKTFPSYSEIINYFADKDNDKINNPKIDYYKKYVDGFKEYGKFYNVKKVYEEYEESEIIEKITKYEKLIESFEELNKKKEKYIYLNNSIGSYLKDKYFFIDYSKSYDEWRKNNPKLVVNNYEFKDLLADLELLLPVNERIKLIGRDKFNFSFYLYLCQNDYFLKDCI